MLVGNVQSSLSAAKEESGHLQDVCEAARQELELTTQKHDEQLKEAQRLQQCLDVRMCCIEHRFSSCWSCYAKYNCAMVMCDEGG